MEQDEIMRTGIRPRVVEEICELARRPGVNRVILVGSRARGDYHRASDIDLAVCGGNIVEFALDVEETTSTLLCFDVVDLGRPLKEEFLARIRRDGILRYENLRMAEGIQERYPYAREL